ncbi:MAG TPA: guanylate kinase, partial [Clostridiales bacterium]|nr:guanylate kinase [Clostridiales bacterium]
MSKKGLLVVLSGPSGSGKDTILTELEKRERDVKISISMTTRKPREWEVDGIHYYFVNEDFFKRKIEEGQILEYAQYGNSFYGTPKNPVDTWLSEGKTVILKIEVQGAEKIRKLYPDSVSIFLMPPSMKVLEERLRKRESEDDDEVARRLSSAVGEIRKSVDYDYYVVNDVVNYAVSDICAIIQAEKQRTSRN